MKENRHQSAIPAEIIEQAKAGIRAVQEMLKPYTKTGLTAQDRMRLPKLGTRTLDFVAEAFSIAKDYPHLLPAGQVPIEEFEKDWNDARELSAVQAALETLQQDMSSLAMLAGSEALQASQAVYGSIKLATEQKIPNAKALYERLKAKQPRTGRRATSKPKDDEQA